MKLGILNSRMKDFYDVWLLSHLFDFKAEDRIISALNLSLNSFKPIITKKAGAINYELEVNA